MIAGRGIIMLVSSVMVYLWVLSNLCPSTGNSLFLWSFKNFKNPNSEFYVSVSMRSCPKGGLGQYFSLFLAATIFLIKCITSKLAFLCMELIFSSTGTCLQICQNWGRRIFVEESSHCLFYRTEVISTLKRVYRHFIPSIEPQKLLTGTCLQIFGMDKRYSFNLLALVSVLGGIFHILLVTMKVTQYLF